MPRYNEDYDPKTDSGFGDAPTTTGFKVDYPNLICPFSLMSGKHITCLTDECAMWSIKNRVCIFCSVWNQLGSMSRSVGWYANREDRRREHSYQKKKAEMKAQREPGEDDAL